MDSLQVTEISCSLSLHIPHTNLSTNTPHSHSAPPHSLPSSSSRQPTTALLNADKNKNSTSAPLLPLPPSRPLFPSTLKFLWFGRDNPSKAPDHTFPIPSNIEETDNKPCACFIDNEECHDANSNFKIEDTKEIRISCEQIAAPEKHVTNTDSESSVSENGWISKFLGLRLLGIGNNSELRSSKELAESALSMVAKEADEELLNLDDQCSEQISGMDISIEHNGLSRSGGGDDDDDQQGLCVLEASEERVVHDKESVSKFLHEVPVTEVQEISKLCLLSNLAYIIPEMQRKDLLKDHHLTFVTSSLIKKEEAEVHAALERAIICARKQNKGVKKCHEKYRSEENAASSKDSFVDVESVHDKPSPSSEDKLCSDARLKVETSHLKLQDQDVIQVDETPIKAGKEATLKAQSSCPCEWFICDDEASSTRYLVIQGSESLASWQTNLSFDPTKFEGMMGVLVHRGIYEAAQTLYELVEEEMKKHVRKGSHARLCFTGHSLGGSLATLLAMMLVKKGVVGASAVEGVVTLGAPCVLCAGERVLQQLSLQEHQFVNVVMHRDIVPRAFACDYPPHVARLLQRVNGTFRHHPCLNFQHLLYAPVGQVMILQPEEAQSPSHPLLPSLAGLYLIRNPSKAPYEQGEASLKIREVQRAFFNMPHPLDALRDPGAYGFEGAISRDHDPRSYKGAINTVLSHGLRRLRRLKRQSRRSLLTIHTFPTPPNSFHPPPTSLSHVKRHALIPSHHIHMGLLFILSITTHLFSSFLSWA